MKRVTGIGGVFFKASDPASLREWYKKHLGIDVQEWGGAVFTWTDGEGKPTGGMTVWSVKSPTDDSFQATSAPFVINYRVADLVGLLAVLRQEGCNVLDKFDDGDFGKFGWVLDPEGNKIELWEPPAGF